MKLVLIEWVDSYGCSSTWAPLDGEQPEALKCRSVGWLLHDAEEYKTIVPHLAVEQRGIKPQGCGDMTIPTRAITKMEVLRP